jgi:hypothetical protein
MQKKSNICSSVEGKKLCFNTRQFFSKPPVINEILGQKVYPFKLGINGYVKIDTPLEDPEQTVLYKTSLIDVGDAVQGGSVDGWSTKPIKTDVSKGSGRHSASFGILNGHSYAHVESSPREHLQSKDIQTRNPEIIEILNPIFTSTEER